VLFNSSGGKTGMKIKGWFKKLLGTGVKNELSPDDMINVDDKKVPVKDLMSAVEDEQADEAKKNEEPKEQELSPDSVIKIGGKDVTLENAINIYKKRNSKKNAEELEIETKKKQEEEDKKNAEEADKKKKDEEMKNAA
jgi:hypothetical protein